MGDDNLVRVFNFPENLAFSEVGHLPIIKEFAKKIKLVETLDPMVDSRMELAPGVTVMAMVLDTLSGRTPLYRFEEFFQEKDFELIKPLRPVRLEFLRALNVSQKVFVEP